MEVSEPKRERQIDLKPDEPHPETQVALPSRFSLEDLIVPNNSSPLEKKTFFTASPQSQAIILGYLAFDSNSKVINSINPRYLVYRAIEFPAQNHASYTIPQNDASYQEQTAYEFASTQAVQYEATPQIVSRPYIAPLIKPSEFLRSEFAPKLYAEDSAKGYDFSATKPAAIYGIKPIAQPIHASPAYDMQKNEIEALNGNLWEVTSSFIGVYKPTDAKLDGEKAHRKTLENVIVKTDIHIFQPQIQIPQISTQPLPKYRRGVDIIVSSYFAGKSSLPYETTPKFQIPAPGVSIRAILASLNPFKISSHPKAQNAPHPKPDISKIVVMAPQAQQYILEESQYGSQEHNNPDQQNSYRAKDKAQAAKSKTQTSNVIYFSDYRNPRRRNNPNWQSRDVKSKYKARLRESTRKLKEAAKRSAYLLTLARATSNQFYSNTKHLYSKFKGKIESMIYNYRAGQTTATPESLSTRINSDNQPNPNNESFENLQNIAQDLEKESGGEVSYIIIDVKTGKILSSRNADKKVSVGSTWKVFLIKHLLELSQQGKINLEDELKLRNSLRPKNYKVIEGPITIREAMREAVADRYGNSNWYTNALLELIGLKRENKMLQQQGYTETVIVDYCKPGSLYREDKTSPNNIGRAMWEMTIGKGLDEKYHKIFFEVFKGEGMVYPIRNPQNLGGLDIGNFLMKHGQSERDISETYRMKGVQDGKEFDGIVFFNLSNISKPIVNGDFKTANFFGVKIMNYFMNASRQVSEIAQSILYKH